MNFSNLHKRRFTLLLITMVAFLLITPLILEVVNGADSLPGRLVIFVISTCAIVTAAFAVSRNQRTTIIAFVLMVPSLLLEFFTAILSPETATLLSHGLRIVFLVFVGGELLREIFHRERVTFDTISASLCVYLLLGSLWGNFYAIAEALHPGSIVFLVHPEVNASSNVNIFNRYYHSLYFSFVTLSTVGYGDVVPTTTAARMLAVTEAIVGQIYLLIMVSRLVGIHVAQAFTESTSEAKK